jgi:hypothetical protein
MGIGEMALQLLQQGPRNKKAVHKESVPAMALRMRRM